MESTISNLVLQDEGRRRVGARRFPIYWANCVDWGAAPDNGDSAADHGHPDLRHRLVSPEDFSWADGRRRKRRSPWKKKGVDA